ncbi:hypothetical protein EDB19DRAFT_1068621 [Suillus lakei]|nr:hypothetical protein EDB19DRAFT_1068621 [Suillus lakei]
MDAEEQISQGLLAPSQEFLASVKVFPLIPYLKKDVINTIDSPLSWECVNVAMFYGSSGWVIHGIFTGNSRPRISISP